MGFWIFMVIMLLLIPGMMLGFGLLFSRRAPKEINYLFGYRTARSMKNQDTWAFAHREMGKRWARLGAICLPLSIVPMLFVIGRDEDTVGTAGYILMILQMIAMIVPIFFTEHQLKIHFDKDGNKIR